MGPFEVEFSAGLFRKARKTHSPDARVTVEFDVRGSDPLDFFVVSSRYVPAEGATPSGVQVFTGSTGGVARGDLFLPGATAADVRVVFENGRFDVAARPLGGALEDYAPVGSFQHGDAGELWTLGVGASRLRKGTELGIDDLVLTPR
jgi:hypothetical protein